MRTYSLSGAEHEIMEFLWTQKEPVALQAVVAYCTDEIHHSWKQQTIYTFLIRLMKKGVVTATKQGNKRFYSAAMTAAELRKKEAHQLLTDCFEGSLKNFLCAFTGGQSISTEEKEILKEFLNE